MVLASSLQRLSVAIALMLIVQGVNPSFATAQAATSSIQASGEFETLRLSELDVTSLGAGVNVRWGLTPGVTVDGVVAYFPGSWQTDATTPPGAQSLLLALAGVRPGIKLGRAVISARGRVGVLDFRPVGQPFACVLVFPAPLTCQLGAGYTALAFDLGGDATIALDTAGHVHLYAGASDLVVRYGLNAIRPNGSITQGFATHNLLIDAGLGWRF